MTFSQTVFIYYNFKSSIYSVEQVSERMKKSVVLLIGAVILLSAASINASEIITIEKRSNYSISNQLLLGNSYQQSLEFTTDEIIIKFKEDLVVETATSNGETLVTTSVDSIDLLNANHGIYSYQKLKVDEDTFSPSLSNIYKLKVPDGSDILSIIEEYEKESCVEFVEPNYIGYLSKVRQAMNILKTNGD